MEFNRDRRTLFNGAASDYDRYRPGYPPSVAGDLISGARIDAGGRLLEIGCGTGQATVSFAKRGLSIDAVELGADTASVARNRLSEYSNVRIHNTPFESFRPETDGYDLIYSAQAFHWIDPETRLSRCWELLAPRGTLALIYNYTPPQDGAIAELGAAIETASGGLLKVVDSHQVEKGIEHWSDELGRSPFFEGLEVRTYPWECAYDPDEYAGLFRTYSDFLSLRPEIQRAVESTIRAFIAGSGGNVVRRYLCTVFRVQRVG